MSCWKHYINLSYFIRSNSSRSSRKIERRWWYGLTSHFLGSQIKQLCSTASIVWIGFSLLFMRFIQIYKNTENAVKINNSPRFTAFTSKRGKKYAVKFFFSSNFLRKFTAKPRPGNKLKVDWKLSSNYLY